MRAAQLKLSPLPAGHDQWAISHRQRAFRAWATSHPDLVFLGIVLAVGGLLRGAFFLRAPVFIISDSENYFLPGFGLARGLGFDLEPRRAPLYPAFIAAVVYGIGQDLASLAFVQHGLGLLTTGLTYWLGRLAFGRLAAFIAALLVALNGSFLVSEQTVGTEALFTASLALAGALSAMAVRKDTIWPSMLAGVVLALSALVRPVALGLLPILPLVLLTSCAHWRRWLHLSALYCIGVALILLPWMVRNFFALRVFSTEGAFGQTLVGRTVRHDRFVFVDPSASPDLDTRRQRARELMQDASRRGSFITPLRRQLMQELDLTELEANRLMRDLAAEAILRQPIYYVLGTARFFVALAFGPPERLREVWQTRRDPDAREEWESHPEIAGLLGPPNAVQERQFAQAERLVALSQPGRFSPVLLALAAVGLAAAIARQAARPGLVPALSAIALLLVAAAFVGPVARYRQPAEPFLAIMVAGGLTSLYRCAVLTSNRVRKAPSRSLGG